MDTYHPLALQHEVVCTLCALLNFLVRVFPALRREGVFFLKASRNNANYFVLNSPVILAL